MERAGKHGSTFFMYMGVADKSNVPWGAAGRELKRWDEGRD